MFPFFVSPNRCFFPFIFLLFLAQAGCPSETVQPERAAAPAEQSEEAQLSALADRLNMTAHSASIDIARTLKGIAQSVKGRLRGLEHQLKTKSSTLRKLKKLHAEDPSKPIDQLSISDALRYTLEIEDKPQGHYVKTVHATLAELEKLGHTVKAVKNYWPKGDNYSGVNTVLTTPKGMSWELQFHTPASYAEAKQSHERYERLRSMSTPLSERQQLFGEMAKPWETIEVPLGVLEPTNLHENEEIKKWTAPSK